MKIIKKTIWREEKKTWLQRISMYIHTRVYSKGILLYKLSSIKKLYCSIRYNINIRQPTSENENGEIVA